MANHDDNRYKVPSTFDMIKSFTRDFTSHVKNGMQIVDLKDYRDRLNACNKCPHLLKERMRCKLCGCYLEHKAKWKTATCPDKPSRWKAQIIENGEKQESNNTDSGD